MNPLAIAERLRAARVLRELSRQQLADAMGCSLGLVKKWEAGTSFPRLDQIPKLLQVLGTDVQQLIQDTHLVPDMVWVDRFDLDGEALPCPAPVLPKAHGNWLAGILRGRGAPVMVVVETNRKAGRHERLAVARISDELALGWLRLVEDRWEFRPERTPYWNSLAESSIVGEVIFLGERVGDAF